MSVRVKSADEIALMRAAGKILAKVHQDLGHALKPGMSTKEIDRIGELNLWEGDRIFLRLMVERESFFSLKLVYDGHDRLVSAALDGKPMEL